MRIAQVIGYNRKISPGKIWGLKRVAYDLTEELVRRGHSVTIMAPSGSKTHATLPSFAPAPLSKKGEIEYILANQLLMSQFAKSIANFDLVHIHLIDFLPFANLLTIPSVTTLHGGGLSSYEQQIATIFPRASMVSVSQNSQRIQPRFNYVGNVYNGIKIDEYEFNNNPDSYLLWMGRMVPEKGALEAMRVAKKVGQKLLLATLSSGMDQKYWKKVMSQLTKNVTVFMDKTGNAKMHMLKNAKALLNPISWEEPFGLVSVEAQACGTPVISFNKGALRETILNNQTGFLVNTTEQMIKAVGKINTIDRSHCRSWVEQNFTVPIMTDNYEKIYEKLTGKQKLRVAVNRLGIK